MRRTRWNLREEAPYLPPIDDSFSFLYSIMMNIIIWNCRGTLKPSFQSDIRELIIKYDLAILVIMETHIGGDRAKEITDRLPFQGAIQQIRLAMLEACGCCGILTKWKCLTSHVLSRRFTSLSW